MRIVLDLQGAQSESRFRGIGRYSLSLAQALARDSRSHDMRIILNGRFEDTIEPLRVAFEGLLPRENISVFDIPGPAAQMYRANAWRARAAEHVRELFLAGLRPDAIITFSLFEGFTSDAITSVGPTKTEALSAVILYDLIPFIRKDIHLSYEQKKTWYYRKLDSLIQSDILLAISESSKKEAIQHLGIPENRLVNISAAADKIFRRISPIDDTGRGVLSKFGIQTPFVMYSGGFDEHKNLDRLIEAFSLLKTANAIPHSLVVTGKAPLSAGERYPGLSQKAGIGNDVVFAGYVDDEDLVMLYNLSSLVVCPSLHEGFGLPALEAMSCGAPVIGSDLTSIPEVIGRKDALFDPTNVTSIAEKMTEVLSDKAFAQSLSEHGLKQSKKFSWEKSASRTLDKLEEMHGQRHSMRSGRCEHQKRPRLACVCPILDNNFKDYRAKLLHELSRYYEIEIVSDDRIELTEGAFHTDGGAIPVRSLQWFTENFDSYERVVYQTANSPRSCKESALLERCPGTVALHDSGPNADVENFRDLDFRRALYHSHGYTALSRAGKHVSDAAFPVDRTVLELADGVMVHSVQIKHYVEKYYGRSSTEDWAIIPYPEGTGNPQNDSVELADPSEVAKKYAEAVEHFAHNGPIARERRCYSQIAQIQEIISPSEDDIFQTAVALSVNRVRKFPPRILLDISTQVKIDAGTGIERVVRSILSEMLMNQPDGLRVEPVYFDTRYYRYARKFTTKYLGLSETWPEDDTVEFFPGDVFFGLDLALEQIPIAESIHSQIKNRGTKVFFMVYDLLPILRPMDFDGHLQFVFPEWLRSVSLCSDGVVCISRATADDVLNWLELNQPQRLRPLNIGVCHIGSDIMASVPTMGLSASDEELIIRFKSVPSFLMVGTIEPRKCHAQALAAFELLWSRGLRANLVMVGKEGWKTSSLCTRLRNHPENGKRLFWLEKTTDEMLLRIYKECRALLMASVGEGFGLPLIEAAQCRLPIIARDLPVFKEIAGTHAFYFRGNSPEDIADAIDQWLQLDEDIRPDSSDMPRLTWKQSKERLEEVLLGGDWYSSWLPKTEQ